MQQALEVDGSENKSLTDIDIVDDATGYWTTPRTSLANANTVTANDATVTEAGSFTPTPTASAGLTGR